MTRSALRNFDCPETGERCTDGRCTQERCCESGKLQVSTTREAASKPQRVLNAKIAEILRPILRK